MDGSISSVAIVAGEVLPKMCRPLKTIYESKIKHSL